MVLPADNVSRLFCSQLQTASRETSVLFLSLTLQAYTALLGSAVKCGEAELAVDVYNQLRSQVCTLLMLPTWPDVALCRRPPSSRCCASDKPLAAGFASGCVARPALNGPSYQRQMFHHMFIFISCL